VFSKCLAKPLLLVTASFFHHLAKYLFESWTVMDGPPQNTLLMLLILGIGLYFLLDRLLGTKLDPREPPNAPSTIPYIGHVLGVTQRKFNYYVELRYYSPSRIQNGANHTSSYKIRVLIFTMAMSGVKIISSPHQS
jgi:hypothetical protein